MRTLCLALLFLVLPLPAAGPDLIQRFPMEAYQPLGRPWLEATDSSPLFPEGVQARKAEDFRVRFLGPWEADYVAANLTDPVANLETQRVARLQGEVAKGAGFGPNFRPYGQAWLDRLKALLPDHSGRRPFDPGRRAVLLDNTPVRLLPTTDLFLQSHTLAGQGYPFDDLQNSALWAGTPVYLLDETRDRAWCKVMGSGVAGWVRSQNVALAGPGLVRQWRRAVVREGLVAAIHNEAPIRDRQGRFRGQAFVGSVFPRSGTGVLFPVRHGHSAGARSVQAALPGGAGVRQPWVYTPHHAATLWQAMLGRPYGWGNINLHNDCSSELKNFFTPFGLWLPRHSTDQRDRGRRVDLAALDVPGRLEALARVGRPYLSLIWFPGHVMLYLGPVAEGRPEAGFMTYQSLWGLRPKVLPDFRSIVGASVLFPVLETYPEAPELLSLAARAGFTVTQLDEEP